MSGLESNLLPTRPLEMYRPESTKFIEARGESDEMKLGVSGLSLDE